MYQEAYREAAADGNVTSTALCVDVRVHLPGKLEKSDAIQIMLEHSGGEALNAFLPYQKQANYDVTYSPLFAQLVEPQVFVKLASVNEQ